MSTMAHVILGLLLIAPMSLYDLIKGFEAGVSLFYSASSGSIKRALDQLLEQHLIEVASADPGARGRKTFRITDAGRAAFRTWMLTPPDSETAVLSRLYFLGLLDTSDRAPVVANLSASIEHDLAQLLALGRSLEGQDVPEPLRDVATYQRATLDYGIAAHQHALDWVQKNLVAPDADQAR